ncbi:MAG: hypothetical protein KJ645_06520 [Planctomycetes bacterium]|nr:hypothetical protein [Planctomycetota bacterium]
MSDEMKTVEEIADAMFKMGKDAFGQKKLKPGDLTKAMVHMFEDKVDKKICKAAIKELVNSGRCVYTYFGGSFLEIPHKEGASND